MHLCPSAVWLSPVCLAIGCLSVSLYVWCGVGIHIVLPHLYTSCSPLGLLLPKTTDNRVLFLLPWQGYTLAGTTDAVCNLSYNPTPSKEEVDWIIKELSSYLKVEEDRLK